MVEPEQTWDVVVVGAGAAGLIAAAVAAERGLRTLLLEKNVRPGVKILMSGGTRCNITQNTDNRGIVAAYGPPGRFLHSALAAFGVRESIAMFEAEGVATKVEDTGKIFPASDKASDVLDALLQKLERSGAVLATEEPLVEVTRADSGFQLRTAKREIHARNLVLTTGGQSYPGSGTTGDGYRFAAELGHTIVPPRPSLVPITTDALWVRELRGITIPDVLVRVVEPAAADAKSTKPTVLAERRSSLLFAHFGLTGPAALDVSRAVSGHPNPRTLRLMCDFLPNVKQHEFDEQLRTAIAEAGKKQLVSLLPEVLPHRLLVALLQAAEVDPALRAAEAGTKARTRTVEAVKACSIPVSGTMGFRKAEVTAGGIALGEVNSSTMESKLVPGLYLAGEVLDLDGPIGGYNFQAAWSTGYLAGSSVE